IRDGWYVTSDIGRLDEDGFLTLTDRLERIAKIAGEMVPLQRVEDELHKILGTADRVLAVAAVPDPKRGEKLVVLHRPLSDGTTMKALLKHLSAAGLPNLWIPDARDCYEVEEFAILGSGKLDLRRLKETAIELDKKRPGSSGDGQDS